MIGDIIDYYGGNLFSGYVEAGSTALSMTETGIAI